MTRRRRAVVRDPDEARRARLARWRRPGAPEVPDPDAPHVGDPDGPRLVPAGKRPEKVTGDDLVRGDGAWRERPAMAAHLEFVRRERGDGRTVLGHGQGREAQRE